jgi:hypothetical protein
LPLSCFVTRRSTIYQRKVKVTRSLPKCCVHAYYQVSVEHPSAEVQTGVRLYAMLYAGGANAAHGLRRTNANKRRAVTMLPDAREWAM